MSNANSDAQSASHRRDTDPSSQADPNSGGLGAVNRPRSGEELRRPARDLPPARDPIPAGDAAVAEAFAHCWPLLEAYLVFRGGAGRGKETPTVACERTTVSKHLFWLVTGRLPARGAQRHLVLQADHATPGWVPLLPEDADDATLTDYKHVLYAAKMASSTRQRELGQLVAFYTWLTGSEDNAAARVRKRKRKRSSSSTKTLTSRQDGFYTPAETRALLQASQDRVNDARAHKADSKTARKKWLAAEVDHVVAWLLWGTGAGATPIARLDITDVDLKGAALAWRRTQGEATEGDTTPSDTENPESPGNTEDRAGTGAEVRGEVLTQPIPAALVAALEHYMLQVRPHLGISGGRLLVNAFTADVYLPRNVQNVTKRLAKATGLDQLPGEHTPARWRTTYSHRIMEAPGGSKITLMWLHDRSSWNGLEKAFGVTTPGTSDLRIDDVYATTTLPAMPTPAQDGPAPRAA